LELLVYPGVIASEGAYADDGDIDGVWLGQKCGSVRLAPRIQGSLAATGERVIVSVPHASGEVFNSVLLAIRFESLLEQGNLPGMIELMLHDTVEHVVVRVVGGFLAGNATIKARVGESGDCCD